ncbi:squamous cell carcinoma antigen recognized by T-cells 3-like [Salvia splendens]|uniref:squamous cell carcinoma antigen recognized by T-cells 3-like n=1 Tax=Salvia splendens TaxID=180675 RepID=UPI001C26E198|nr:squamous cell carcinoma antigen recognized by T-cells 3-like [Salvia splendens]XP_042007905.1 squamous cell carcinoma antigen recognized by T-cells 3-like [Salvia splendens]
MADSETLVAAQSTSLEEDSNTNDVLMPDAKNPTEGSDSDSESESDSDSEDESQAKAQIEALETQLYNNPSDYDTHVQYIKALRKQGELEKLSQAREAMSSLFPLTPDMWRKWAKDQTTVSSSLEALPQIEKLYERGVSDYMSVDLWCDYLNFVQEHDPSVKECSAVGISKARNLFERALTAAGLHVDGGHHIWELYREFEQAIIFTIDETDSAAKEKQIQRVRNLFHRQLSIPHTDLKSTLAAYQAWEADQGRLSNANNKELDDLPSHVVSVYQKALEMLYDRAHLEENISKSNTDSEKLQDFMTYLKFEHSSGDPARIQILYERAIAVFPVSADLWLDYTQYLDKTFKTARIVRDSYYRATRNCPWVGELWVRYLLALERCHASEEELSTVFERSLLCTFSGFDEYLNVFLTRADGLRRRMSSSTAVKDEVDYAIIRDVFQRASDYLSPHLKNTESLLRLHSYWARLELKYGKDLTAARGVWESLLKICGSMMEAWQAYVAWEIETGNINEGRSLYKRCYSKRFPGTGSEDICHSWLRFEREYGSLEEFDIAVQKVSPRLQELQLFRSQQESKNGIPAANERENPSKKSAREKRKPTSHLVEEQPPAKHHKSAAQNSNKKNQNDKSQPRQSAEPSEAAELKNKNAERAKNQETDKSSKKSIQFNDQCTAFVSNLNLQATADDLHNFFADAGGVVAVRLLKDKFTRKSRGLAYVDFSDDAHLAAALQKNKQIFMGKKLSILKSDPKQGRKKEVAGRSGRAEPGRTDTRETPKGKMDIQPQSPTSGHDDVQLKGRNTFAVPRNVKPLGWSSRSAPPSDAASEQEADNPKSNDEFRKMLMKS